MGHSYKDHSYKDHSYKGHTYVGHNYVGHNYISRLRVHLAREQVQLGEVGRVLLHRRDDVEQLAVVPHGRARLRLRPLDVIDLLLQQHLKIFLISGSPRVLSGTECGGADKGGAR